MATIIKEYRLRQGVGSIAIPVKEAAAFRNCKWLSSQTLGLIGVAVYAEVDDTADDETRTFQVVQNDDAIPADSAYVGSVEDDEDNLFHVYVENVGP